jgi:signal peptidase I
MASEDVAPPPQKQRRSVVRELVETAVLTVAIFLLVRVAVQNFKVEGESMLPNLHDGEYILVNKVDYYFQTPQRGDIVVFKAVPAGQPDRDFIKRVIGVPGDTVAVRNNTVYINGHKLAEPYKHYPSDYTFGPRRVPADDYFVLGDHRNDSYDSSKWATPWLPKADIIGKAWIAYWPLSDAHIIGTPTYRG